MERKYFALPGFRKAFLQIGSRCSSIPLRGQYSYACDGQETVLYLVDVDNSVIALVLNGYINRIKTKNYNEWVYVTVEVFTRQAGANPKIVKEDFSYEWVDIL